MTQIAKGYAEALFALALETDNTAAFSEGLTLAASVFRENPDYVEFLACYGIPAVERTQALETAFGDRLPEYVCSLLQLMCERGHIADVFDCAAEYETLYLEAKRLSTVKVTGAVALTPAQREKLEQALVRLCHRRVRPTYDVDPALIGGVVIEVDGKVYDGSVRHKLQEVKEVIRK